MLAAIGGAGAVGLAGCAGGDGSGSDGSGGDGSGEDGTDGESSDGGGGEETTEMRPDVDLWFEIDTWTVPKRQEWNPYNATGDSEGGLVFEDFMGYYRTAEDAGFTSTVLEDVSIEGTTATLSMYDHHVWHDGEPVTAADTATKLKLEKFINGPVADYVDTVGTAGEHTVELGLKNPISPAILKWTLVWLSLDTPAPLYGEHVTKLEEAGSDEKRKQARKALTEFNLGEPVGFGPGRYESADSNVLVLSTHDKHPRADSFNWNGWRYKYLPTNQKTWQALKAGRLDGFDHFMSPNVMEGMPDPVEIYLLPMYVGENVLWNLEREPFSDLRVRKALAHVVDRKSIADTVGGGKLSFVGDQRIKRPVRALTGTSNAAHEQYLAEIADQFTEYGDEEAAVGLLQEAGYSRTGDGTWVDDAGDPISFVLQAPSCCNDLIDGVRTAASQLEQFGVQAEFKTEEGATFWSAYGEGKFDGMGVFWGAYGKRHPYFDFRQEFAPSNHPNVNGFDPQVTVSDLPNGEGGELDLPGMVQELSMAQGEEAKALIQDLAYAFNQTLPELPLIDKQSPSFMTSDAWAFPEPGAREGSVAWPHTWFPKNGALQALPESEH
jgi:peptide/nickel transport system substrate-binding protein